MDGQKIFSKYYKNFEEGKTKYFINDKEIKINYFLCSNSIFSFRKIIS